MKRISLILLLSFCTVILEAQAEVSPYDQFGLFTSCAPINLVVEDMTEDGKRINLTEEAVRNSVESRLRSSRIFDETSFYYLYVNINVARNGVGMGLEFKKPVRDYYFPELIGSATSWSARSAGTSSSANFILSKLSKQTDQFLVEYFRVNGKACNKIR